MKAPRITDFDPNAPEAPDEAAATAKPLGSPLDGMPAIVRPGAFSASAARTSTAPDRSTSVPPVLPVRGVPPPPTAGQPPSPQRTPGTTSTSGQLVTPQANAAHWLGVELGAGSVLRRAIKQRHPFDIYADQLDSLRHLAYEERIQGGVGSMSAMVRDALDAYIAAKTSASVGSGNDHTAEEEHGEHPHPRSGAVAEGASHAPGASVSGDVE